MTQTLCKNCSLFSPGHRACAGCGEAIAERAVANALGPDVISCFSTGCTEVTTSPYPFSAWGMPWIHSVFENAAAVATGVYNALKQKKLDKKYRVVAHGGDGATFDIGFGLVSGMWERKDPIIYICYDNEAYMNTGVQASGSTPYAAATTTCPPGKEAIGSLQFKKDMPAIALGHGLKYVATACSAYPLDIQEKVRKAKAIEGPSYIQILTPCPIGWGHESQITVELARYAVETNIYPLYEYTNGQLTKVMKVPKPRPVEDYLKPQKRFRHLFKDPNGKAALKIIQTLADEKAKQFGTKI